ncbi:hypothetical protein D9M73_140520 [compost metagenome]
MPLPSAPMIRMVGPVRSWSYRLTSASPAVPTTHKPRCWSFSRVRARLVTATSGITSAAPQAIFRTTGVRVADLSFGTITASAPAASAERRQAPRLCGSVTPSSTSNNGAPSVRSSSSSSIASPQTWLGLTSATTPWCTPSTQASISRRSAWPTCTRFSLASSISVWTRGSLRPSANQICFTRFGW